MIPEPLRRLAWSRANGRCEYCQMPQSLDDAVFEIDHIIAEKHGGLTDAGNLALACFSCNAHKGPNIAGIDPLNGQLCRLFHPRNDVWTEHFAWQQAFLEGLTAEGRTTIQVLAINAPLRVAHRHALWIEGAFPSEGS